MPCSASTCDVNKEHNTLQHNIKKSMKNLASLKKQIDTCCIPLSGHYSKKNVDKRQKRADAKAKILLNAEKNIAKQNQSIDCLIQDMASLKRENLELRRKNFQLLSRSLSYQRKTTNAQRYQRKLKMKLKCHQACIPSEAAQKLVKKVIADC